MKIDKMGLIWLLLITLFLCFVYQYILKTWWYFERRNVKYERGIPILGSTYRHLLGWECEADYVIRICKKFKNERFFGVYDLLGRPSYVIRDPELIKQIGITDFESFRNHRFQFDEDVDPMVARNLFSMRDEKWRRMRATMSPAFTGNKMRLMHRLMVDYTEVFISDLRESIKTRSDGRIFEAKNLLRCYANDIIATCAFGIEINSLRDPDNEFFRHGRELMTFDVVQGLKLMASMCVPWLMKWLRMQLIPEKHTGFFRSVILSNIEQRERHKIVRNDMVDLLIKARAGQLNDNDEPAEIDGFVNVGDAEDSRTEKTLESKLNYIEFPHSNITCICNFVSQNGLTTT